MSYKTFTSEVEVDLSEWDDEELKEELESRGSSFDKITPSRLNEEDAWLLGRLIRGGHMDEVKIFLEPLLAKHGIIV